MSGIMKYIFVEHQTLGKMAMEMDTLNVCPGWQDVKSFTN